MPSDADPPDESIPPKVKERRKSPSDAPPPAEPSVQRDVTARPERINALVLSLASFCLIAFGVWLVSAGKAYREEYAQVTGGWRVGTSRSVELTLVAEDRHKLACASDQVVAGLRCGHGSNGQKGNPSSSDSPQVLQPYNTVGNELLLGAGLWTSPDLKGTLPRRRFVAVCNYNIKGILRSASIRFDVTAPFGPIGKTVTVGTLTDCVLPR